MEPKPAHMRRSSQGVACGLMMADTRPNQKEHTMAKKKPKPKPTYTASLRPEAAELVARALEQQPAMSSSAFTATALCFYALKVLDGKWPKKLPEDLLPKKPGRQWPKKKE